MPSLSVSNLSNSANVTYDDNAFDTGEQHHIRFDIDTGTTGSAFGQISTFSVLFQNSSGTQISGTTDITAALGVVGSETYANTSTVTIPEPGTMLLAGILLGSFGGLHLLKRRKS